MRWAYPSPEDLEDKLLLLYGLGHDSAVKGQVESKLRSMANLRRFGPVEVGKILQERLQNIEGEAMARA
jgi:hypothetical protein